LVLLQAASLSLALGVPGIGADNPNHTLALNHAAPVTSFFYRSGYFQRVPSD